MDNPTPETQPTIQTTPTGEFVNVESTEIAPEPTPEAKAKRKRTAEAKAQGRQEHHDALTALMDQAAHVIKLKNDHAQCWATLRETEKQLRAAQEAYDTGKLILQTTIDGLLGEQS